MSRWQRLGVVISVLWLLGLPTYLWIDQNSHANNYFSSCIEPAPGRSGPPPGAEMQAVEDCRRQAGFMTPGEVAQMFVTGKWAESNESETQRTIRVRFLWISLLGPVIFLWLVGGIVIGTVRWVRRGFANSSQ